MPCSRWQCNISVVEEDIVVVSWLLSGCLAYRGSLKVSSLLLEVFIKIPNYRTGRKAHIGIPTSYIAA